MAMTVEIKGNKLCIEIDLEKPTPSSSRKTLVVASTRGNTVTDVQVDGRPVTIGLNERLSAGMKRNQNRIQPVYEHYKNSGELLQ